MELPSTDPHPLGAGLYRTNVFHRQPLFAVDPEPSKQGKSAPVVRSWGEAHALHGPARATEVNPGVPPIPWTAIRAPQG
jgi:hypothetical protein